MAFDGIKSIISEPYRFGVLTYPQSTRVEEYIKKVTGYPYVGLGYIDKDLVTFYMYEPDNNYFNINDPTSSEWWSCLYLPFVILGNKVNIK